MRQAHIGGDKLLSITPTTRCCDRWPAYRLDPSGAIFVAVVGASTRAFAALGGVPNLLVPDNTKVAIILNPPTPPPVITSPGRRGKSLYAFTSSGSFG